MKKKKMDFQLFLIVLSVIVTGGLAINAHLSESKKEKELKNKTEEIIGLQKKLAEKSEETIQKQNDLILEQKENKIISKDILKLQGKLDSNTTAISKISKEISKVSTNTNQISNVIKNEQREKGKFEFDINDDNYDRYTVKFGGATIVFTKEQLIKGKQSGINDIVFSTKFRDGKFLFSLRLYNHFGDVIFDMVDGHWSLKKSEVFSVNFDSVGVEMINKQGNVFLQIDLVGTEFRISGTFFAKDHVSLMTPRLLTRLFYNDLHYSSKLSSFYSTLDRKFVHYGEDYLGKRLK